MGKNPKNMDLKDFDTKWFVGVSLNTFLHDFLKVLRSINQQRYAAIVAAQKLSRLRS